MKKIGITTDCVCDLPEEYFLLNDIGVIYFYITTDSGRFCDMTEVTSENIIDYLESGRKVNTHAPSVEEYISFFDSQLEKYEEIIHICVSDSISLSYRNASLAALTLKIKSARVTVVDSEHLSTGIGHLVIKAVNMRDRGKSAQNIFNELESMKKRIRTSFIAMNADYLNINGKVPKIAKDLCDTFRLHPVIVMRNGKIRIGRVYVGDYWRSCAKYVKRSLRQHGRIDKTRAFITHVGCTVSFLNKIRAEADKHCKFDELITTKASATVSSNCGKWTFGIVCVNK